MFALGYSLPYNLLEAQLQAVLPADLMTILAVDDKHEKLRRMHTSAPHQYAVGDEWPLLPSVWQLQVLERGAILICQRPTEVLEAFRDGAEILANGYSAVIALPIACRHAGESHTVGVVNMLFKAEFDPVRCSSEINVQRAASLVNMFTKAATQAPRAAAHG